MCVFFFFGLVSGTLNSLITVNLVLNTPNPKPETLNQLIPNMPGLIRIRGLLVRAESLSIVLRFSRFCAGSKKFGCHRILLDRIQY